MITYKIKVIGRVQGVGFRYYTREEAVKLGLIGSVKNLSDGSVGIIVQGTNRPMIDFLEWCHDGPPTALVSQLNYEEVGAIADTSFEIVR